MGWRYGIFWGNDNDAEWPRSGRASHAQYNALVTALEVILTGPPSPQPQAVRAVVAGVLGDKWRNETDAWFHVVVMSVGMHLSPAAYAKVQEMFPYVEGAT